VRVKSKVETYGALAHTLRRVVDDMRAARKTIAAVRRYFPEDAPTLDQVDARLGRAAAVVDPAVGQVEGIVPVPSQPAPHKPISET
jgi:hypothetical protein